MAVKVTVGIVNDGTEDYVAGDVIVGLKESDEQKLIALGVAEYISEPKPEKPAAKGKGEPKEGE